jgi:hypothetical protein
VTGIISKLRFGCNPLPESHHITVYNEHLDGSTWVSYSSDPYNQPDGPGVETTRYGTYYGCISGKWRARFVVSGISSTGIAFGPIGDQSQTVTIKCP